VQICLCHVNVAIDLPGLPQIPAPATDQSCAATSSANTLIGVGCPHPPPSRANLHSARRSRRHRLPFPAGSFIEGFRTPATVQAASLRSAGIRNPQQKQTFETRTDLAPFLCLTCRAALKWVHLHHTQRAQASAHYRELFVSPIRFASAPFLDRRSQCDARRALLAVCYQGGDRSKPVH
jgi:hypothetical protein